MLSRPHSLLSGFGWSGFAELAKLVIQFSGIVILVRLLPPADFGIIALATVFTAFAGLIQDFGTSTALVQRKVVSQALISTIFWLNIIIGLALCLLMAGIAPFAALLLQEPRLTEVLIVLSLVFPLSTAGAMQRAMLQRAGRFTTLARQEVTNAIFSLAAAVLAAVYGWGVYSLVVQQLVSAGLSTLQTYLVSPVRPSWQWSGQEFRETWHFTSHLLVFRCITYFARNSDNILIGRFLGSTELAWYSMAYRVLLVPIQAIGRVMNRVLLPYYSREQETPDRIGPHFLNMMAILGITFGPAFALVWGVRDTFVLLFFGPEWYRVGEVLAWLAPVGFIQTISNNVGLLLSATANTRLLRNIGFISMIGFLVAFCVGLPFGVTGVAAAYFFANLIIGCYTLDVSLRLVGKNVWALCRCLWRQALISLALGAAIHYAEALLPGSLSPWVRFAALAAGGLLLYVLMVGVFARDVLHMVWGLRLELGGRPDPLA
jgi:O-antigen/teichoic acid export membrane protein